MRISTKNIAYGLLLIIILSAVPSIPIFLPAGIGTAIILYIPIKISASSEWYLRKTKKAKKILQELLAVGLFFFGIPIAYLFLMVLIIVLRSHTVKYFF